MATRKKKTTTTFLSAKGYAEFVKNLRLVAIGLERSSTQLDRGSFARLRSKKDAPRRKITATYDMAKLADDHFDLSATFVLTFVDKETKETPLTVECTFGSHFHGQKPLNEAFVRQFAQSEFRLVVWPFFRQFVFDITGRMAIPPVTIPLSEDN